MPERMKGLVVDAEWAPRGGIKLPEDWVRRRRTYNGNLTFKNPRLEFRDDIQVPELGPKDVKIAVKAVGICGSDVHFYETDEDGYIIYPGLVQFPVVIGHEWAGEVVEVGKEVKSLKPGDWVMSEEMLWCGECNACRHGYFNQCYNLEELGFTVNGAMAEYVVIHEKYVWKLEGFKERFSDPKEAFMVGATVEPTAVSYNAIFVRAGGIKPGSSAAVFGTGPIGLSAVALLKAAGAAKVIAFEISDTRREIAKKMGADFVYDPRQVNIPEVLMEHTGGEGIDFVVEAAGVPHLTIPEAEKALAIGAKVVQIGRAPKPAPLFLEYYQIRMGQLFGSQGHSGNRVFKNVIAMMAAGLIDTRPMITSVYPLEKSKEAVIKLTERKDAKIMVVNM